MYSFCFNCSRGILANAGEFLGCTCCQKRDEKLDWTKTYSLPKHYSRDKGAGGSDSKGSNVRIPLPFSRTWDPKQDSLQSTRNKTRRQVSWMKITFSSLLAYCSTLPNKLMICLVKNCGPYKYQHVKFFTDQLWRISNIFFGVQITRSTTE